MEARDEKGRFVKGWKGGPGRPRREVEADYLDNLTDAVSPEDFRAIVTRAVTDAKKGDSRARDWLSRYLIGDRLKIEHIPGEPADLRTEDLIAEAQAILASVQ